MNGSSIGICVSSVDGSTDASDPLSGYACQDSIVSMIYAGYSFGVSKDVALGLTGTYNLADTKSGSIGSANLASTKHYSINFKPGYRLDTSSLNGIGYLLGIEVLLD